MITIPGPIPITIRPTFWVVAALIGYVYSMSLSGTLIWMGIIFISVLFHEFGHALTALLYKKKPRIELVAFGGVTYHESEDLPVWKQFFVIFDGPLFGFMLFLFASALLKFVTFQNESVVMMLATMQWINLFWTALNLLPVMPLDGGQLLRVICEGFWGIKGFKYAILISALVATLISLAFFLYQAFLIGALFFLLAFQSFETWRKSRSLSEQDRSAKIKKLLEEAEHALETGRRDEAKQLFDEIRARAKEGMSYLLATEYLAYLYYEERAAPKAYALLLPLQDELSSDALCLLQKAAFDEKNYALVVSLSGECYQALPTAETALRTARSCAALGQESPAVGWLETAQKDGLENLDLVIKESFFDSIRQSDVFQEFIRGPTNPHR